MIAFRKHPLHLALAAGLLFSVVPAGFYWMVIGKVPKVNPAEASVMLERNEAVLVDIREKIAFDDNHLANAVSWPFDELRSIQSPASIPAALSGKRLLLICPSGISSSVAAKTLLDLGVPDVFSVADGMHGYIVPPYPTCPLNVASEMFADADTAGVTRLSPWYEQFALVFTGFGVKPLYMTASILLALLLWRARASDLSMLRRGLFAFFLGEGACAINYLAFNLQSHLWEYFHSLGMVVSFGFFAYAFMEGLDARLLHLSDPASKCSALGLCRICHKRSNGTCGLERCFLWFCIALWIAAWMPYCSPLRPVSYNTAIYGTTYNYSHHALYQMFESRYCPVFALTFLALCAAVLAFKKGDPMPWAKALFALGAGPFLFSFFRLFVFGVYSDNIVWFNFWEEITEGLLIAGIAIILWTFRRTLFPREDQPSTSA